MTIEEIECFGCHNGLMEKLQNPHSYDFNKEGYIPRICNSCGLCNDIEKITSEKHIMKTRFSNHFIETVLEILSNKQRRFSYTIKKLLVKKLINRNINCPYDLSELIVLEAKNFDIFLDWDLIIYIIYAKSGAYLSFNSYV